MDFKRVYFIGIGGSGMNALARYFLASGLEVAGYDRLEGPTTRKLIDEGAAVHYDDDTALIPEAFRDPATTAVVYTAAIYSHNNELEWFRSNGFDVMKRAVMLGRLARGKFVMAVSGSHGKTTTTTLTAWLNRCLTGGGSAFLGGVSKNFGSSMVIGGGDRLAVEADEYDRSFLQLYPNLEVITSVDAEHLDIYGTHQGVKDAFSEFVRHIQPGGAVIIKKGVDITLDNPDIEVWRYSREEACDFYARNIRAAGHGRFTYDIVLPDRTVENCTLGAPGYINIENSVAAVAMVWCAARRDGSVIDNDRLREALAQFRGVKTRLDIYVEEPEMVYIDDYAHHHNEIIAAINSIREMFPERRITAVFQPHLYTRTRDMYAELAGAISLADDVVVTPLCPAREMPIEGVDENLVINAVTVPCYFSTVEALPETLERIGADLFVTFGAGDIHNSAEYFARETRKRLVRR